MGQRVLYFLLLPLKVMDKKISEKIKTLVADNKLEEALDLIIGVEQGKGQERYNTLLLLKGKLSMLEEQELAGLLDFEELAQQKLRIAHALLKMANDGYPSAPAKHTGTGEIPPAPSSPIFKYLLMGAFAVIALLAVLYVADRSKNKPPKELTQEQVDPVKEKPREIPPQAQRSHSEEKLPAKTADLPAPAQKGKTVRLLGFPDLDRPFNFGDIRYTFKEVEIEQYQSGASPKLKLTLKMNLKCRNNLGVCNRETVRILVDGKPIAPTGRPTGKKWMESGSSTQEKLSFIFDKGAKQYRIKLEKNRSNWTRGFKILE